MQLIEAALAAPGLPGVLIRGAEGAGKTRFAQEARAIAEAHGQQPRWTAGTVSAREIPLGAFAAWVPEGVTDTLQLLRGVIDALSSPTEKVVLFVDDVQLLDDLSTFVVHQIVARQAAKVILTARNDDPIPVATQQIWAARGFERLDVNDLPCDETADLLSAALAGPVAPDTAKRLWELTLGNVLYLQHIVEHEVSGGRLIRDGGCWRWTGDPIVPPGLIELVESRIGTLPEPVRDVIDALAVCEPMGVDVLTRIAGADALEEAECRGLVTLSPAGDGIEVRTAHPLYGRIRRMRAPRMRLRRLRALVATALGASADGDELRNVVRRAALAVDSDLTPDADLLVRAAHGAVWLGDLALAERLAGAANRAAAGFEASLIRAHALSWLGRGEDAELVFAGIENLALTDRDRARFAFFRSSNFLWALGDPSRAKEFIDEAAQGAAPEVQIFVDAFLTVYWFAMDRPHDALACSTNSVLDDVPVVGAEIAWVLTQLAADAGRIAAALAHAERGYLVASRSLDAPHMRFNIADAEVCALWLAGRLTESTSAAERIRCESDDLPGAAQSLGTAVAGRAALGAGDVRSACGMLEQAVDGLHDAPASGWGYRYRIPYVTALAMHGSTAHAAAGLEALDGVRRRFRSLDYERAVARAWVAAAQGAVSEAVAVLRSAAHRAQEAGRYGAEVLCLQTAGQFGDQAVAERLRELESIVEGPRVGVAARFAEALRDDDPDGLALASTEFERIGDLVAAVDAAAHAAIAYREHGRSGSALTCSTRAEAIAERCGLHTPALRRACQPLPLTGRELEIVALIAGGLTNREVAERLTLSVRTVESHVYRAMQKTGASREELAKLIAPRQ
ncbi:helix-turn-helix transcriptional regulator [Mycolicibacterium flavescens]|nr:helix-turn-helix transcriptional regulator [Mycolicibacterium flavescens]MCV7280616.1 helix-turn-helix transcriptional regulator [Mycolicibacterium flavescens]